MDSIKTPNSKFVFDDLILASPVNSTSGNHFIKYLHNDVELYIQPPKCIIKQNIVKASRRMYCDLMFSNDNIEFISWLENLEKYSQDYIFSNREKWFETQLDESDIENSFTSPIKTYKSGKFYILRVTIPVNLGKIHLPIFNEEGNVLTIDDIKENDNVMSVLEFKGIKCSPRSFQIDIELKQMLLLKPNNIFDKCVFKNVTEKTLDVNESLENISNTETENIKTIEELESGKREHEIVETEIAETEIIETEKREPEKIEQLVIEQPEKTLDNIENVNTEKIETVPEKILEKNTEPNLIDLKDPIEIDIPLEEVSNEILTLKKRNDIYYTIYREALKKAKEAKSLALSTYLEVKRIKNQYMLDDIDEESDLEDASISTSDE
jgi:hypothetical protein